MRPEALEVDGFTVFREPARVEFTDADLFAFTGPTGAGKSSLIDAMIFALYGSVPRLGERAVAPVISQGRQDARVRLDFALGDERYTAVRVVRRGSAGNASTREARLERGDEVVAGNVRELDAAIERLIGLDFRQFTTCAVLPQGDFARFLHAPPADRQKLLTQLLGFAVYGAMRQRANQRTAVAQDRMGVAQHRLEGLASVNKKLEKAQAKRLAALKALRVEATQALAAIAGLEGQVEAVAPRRAELAARLKALGAVRMPGDVRELASELLSATQTVAAAEQALTLARADLDAAEAARIVLGDKDELGSQQRLHRERADVEGNLAQARQRTEQAREKDAGHQAALAEATQAANAARDALDDARRTHAAHELRGHLVAGESCPVCGQSVVEEPASERPPALATLEDAEGEANAGRDAAHRASQRSGQELAAAVAVEDGLSTSLDDLSARLRDAPSLVETEGALSQIESADREQREATQRRDDASQSLIAAQRARQAVAEREAAAWTAYHSARNSVVGLTPPAPRPDDLTTSWVDLQTWTTKTIPEVAEQDKALGGEASRLAAEIDTRRCKLAALFEAHGIEFSDDPPASVLEAVTQTSVALADTQKKRKEKKLLRAEVGRAKADVDVAETLARHLRADGFERWLLHEAFGRLSRSASELLLELSDGQYEFRHNDRLEFEVIDHANAGEARSARTLSGGETFLASLSLALALADEVADLATEGTARLESIFLDEGFGTLDPGTLDVVATAIEEVGARGRMVGVVTHVAALAERIPVQFKVAKASGSASVQRIDT